MSMLLLQLKSSVVIPPEVVLRPVDPFYANVVFLSGWNSINPLRDESYTRKIISYRGSGGTDVAAAKFGIRGLKTDAAGGAVASNNNDYYIATNEAFTFEMWVRPDATMALGGNGGAGVATLFALNNSTGTAALRVEYAYATGTLNAITTNSAATAMNFGGAAITLEAGTWYHIAVSRDTGMTYRLYVNGQISGANVNSSTVLRASSPYGITFGYQSADPTNTAFTGSIDEVRFTRGIARYGSVNFTPPTSTFGRTNIDDFDKIVFQSGFDGSVGDKPAFEESKYAKALTYIGTAAVGNLARNGTGGVRIPASSYVTAPASMDWAFNGPFTIEFGIRFNSGDILSGVQHMMAVKSSGDVNVRSWSIFRYSDPSAKINFEIWNGAGTQIFLLVGNWAPVINQYYHIAVTRDASNNVRIFVDGVMVAIGTYAGTLPSQLTMPLGIGGQSNNSISNCAGTYDDVRIIKGTCLYFANFTVNNNALEKVPPVADPYISNVRFLSGFETTWEYDARFDDVRDLPIIYSGGAAPDGHQANRFGPGGLIIPAAGNAKVDEVTDFMLLGTDDFTIEAWVKPSGSISAVKRATVFCLTKGTARALYVHHYNNKPVLSYVDEGFSVQEAAGTSAWVPNTGTWYHIALVRQAGVFKLFYNGALNAVGSYAGKFGGGTTHTKMGLMIGNVPDLASYDFPGYFDEVRYTKGVARYTAAFTPTENYFPRS